MVVGASSSVDVSTLYGFTRFLTDTLENVSAFSDANILALLNIEYRETQTYLLSQIMFDWKENTLNGTGSGLINLVANTNNYAFPTDMLTLDRAEINYTGNSNSWKKVTTVKLGSIGQAINNTTNNNAIKGSKANPLAWARDGRIYVDPIADVAVTGGFKVYCTTLITDLATGTDAAATPVFVKSFHQILAYGAAIRWLETKEQFNKAAGLEKKKISLLLQMVDFYSKRDSDDSVGIRPKARSMR
jgi:hypothetical protein